MEREDKSSKQISASAIKLKHDFYTTYGFTLVRAIGKGRLGTVVLAKPLYDRRESSMKALKILAKPEEEEEEGHVKYLVREAAILRSLRHEHIMGKSAVFECPDNYVMCMPYCPQGSLRDFLSKSDVLLAVIKEYMIQLSSAVHYLHGRRVVHRDIKTDNILLSGGNLILSDFGLACLVGSKYCRELCGTEEYMAPELKEHFLQDIDLYKCDMYAVGVVFCKMVFGTSKVKDGMGNLEFLRKQSIPEFCKDIGDNLLHKDFNVRWDSGTLKNDLCAWPSMADMMDTLDD